MSANSTEWKQIESQVEKFGFSDSKLKETLRNQALSKRLSEFISQAEEICVPDKCQKVLLYSLASKLKQFCPYRSKVLIEYICEGKIVNDTQLAGAINYLFSDCSTFNEGYFNSRMLDEAAGVGKLVTASEIEDAVRSAVQAKKKDLERRNFACYGEIIAEVKRQLKWADGKAVKDAVENQLVALLGDRSNYVVCKSKPSQEVTVSSPPAISNLQQTADGGLRIVFDFSSLSHFHKPGENYKTDGYIVHSKTMQLLKDHLKRTGSKVITRFPPEPNGILHIGHAKSINLNFGYAKEQKGITYLRFDDTNPEKEEKRFFNEIISIVDWLGYKPFKITYASDYFDRMYELARILISKDLAYVCHQTIDELQQDVNVPSPWRNRPVAESLVLFEDMKDGLFDEKAATLRMKTTMNDGKEDPVAYRIKYAHHARSGDKWCIYPTYDYTHCLNDAFEDITHSLCTKEFQNRRSSYYWLCNALDLYCPVQWEFGRLNLYYTVVSKRKIVKLIEEHIVSDWDDPRLFTLAGLRRRGFPPEAINLFCAKIGVTTAQSTLHPDLLDSCAREVLNLTARRAMAVSRPLRVCICNFPSDFALTCAVADFPADPAAAEHSVVLSREVFIDSSDFAEVHSAGYRRFSPSQPVGLRHTGYVLVWKATAKEPDGTVVVTAEAHKVQETEKPKAFIQWVSALHSQPAVLRFYSKLFKHENPEDKRSVPEGFLSDVNEDSLIVEDRALVDQSIPIDVPPFTQFQFERMGYFSVDSDSSLSPNKLVFNLTVTLKEDIGKRNDVSNPSRET